MDVSLAHFLQQVLSNPALTVTTLLTLGVIFVNGWTDAPNAIATCVTTRCMRVRSAVIMAAIFNFLGVFIMTQLNASVASTISNMVDFGGDTNAALIALCAALFSIVVYSVGASLLGIPTSESHSLIAGLSGAAIAIQGGIGGINMDLIAGLPGDSAEGFRASLEQVLDLGPEDVILFEIDGAAYFLADIGLRMLTPRELYMANGFPVDYKIERDYTGTVYPKTKQVARCGNAVPPPFATALVRANLPEWCSQEISTMEELEKAVAV